MLPTINGNQPEQTAPGTNPNQRMKNKGLMGEYSKTMISQMADNISPSNFVRQGTYGAFGNNALTRTAMGAMDATGGLIDKFLGIEPDEDKDTPTDKLLKEQIKLLTKTNEEIDDTNKILKELLEVEKTKIQESGKKKEMDVSEVENIKKKKKEKIHPKDFSDLLAPSNDMLQLEHKEGNGNGLTETMNRDLVDMKNVLSDGLETIENTFSKEKEGFGGKRRKMGDVEDANIISETHFGDDKKKDKTIQKKYQVDSVKLLKRIAIGVDKIYEILSQSTDMEEKAESAKKEKHMGMVDEVTDVVPKEIPKIPDGEGGGIGGAAAALISTLITLMYGAKDKLVDMFKTGMEKFKGALESAWEFGKDTVSKAFSWVKEKGGSLLESAEKAAGEVGEKIAGKGGLKAIAKKGLGSALKAIPGVGEVVMGGMAAYDAYDASQNAKDILGIEGRDPTTGEKIEAGVGGTVESLSFGLISKEKTAKWIDGLMTDKNDKQDKLNEKQKELNQNTKDKVSPPAEAAGSPSVAVNTTNNSYFANRKMARNDDSSYNRYLDRHYAF